jgi:hypothetical protein
VSRVAHYPQAQSGDVLILGAGFSRSLSPEMPLTDDLGNDVMPRVIAASGFNDLPVGFSNGNFEVWLSRIAEDQPDLTSPENLRNKYVFELCSQSLGEVLTERVTRAADAVLATEWFLDLLHVLHARRATLITFNQDVLVELAVNSANIAAWDRELWERVGPQASISRGDVLDALPPVPPGRWGFDTPRPTLKLLKLHGSTNWYWQPGDTSGASVASWQLPGEATQQSPDQERADRERELPGRVPMIVPPSSAKSMFYRSPLLTKLWQDARRALAQGTGEVVLVGYSMPLTDLVTVGMVRETIGDGGLAWQTPIIVVNPSPDAVVSALQGAGVSRERVSVLTSVAEFAEDYADRAARDLTAHLREHLVSDGTTHLLVGSSLVEGQKVEAIRPTVDGVLYVEAMSEVDPYRGTNISPAGTQSPCKVDDLVRVLAKDDTLHTIVVIATGLRPRKVLATAEHTTNVGVGVGDWQVLITGPARSSD